MKDAYDNLFKIYPKNDFFQDGLNDIIFVSDDKIQKNWQYQKEKLFNNQELYIRRYGRDKEATELFFHLYCLLFDNENIKEDASNNHNPTKLLTELTGYSKTTKNSSVEVNMIRNYQVSHLFGRTKNPLLFTAAWNIAYIPKYLDPFTGHETQGGDKQEFQVLFNKTIMEKFSLFIAEYNLFVGQIEPKLENALRLTKDKFKMEEKKYKNFEKEVKNNWSRII